MSCKKTSFRDEVAAEFYLAKLKKTSMRIKVPQRTYLCEVFEVSYRQNEFLTFGLAVEAAKLGKRIARKGWNGKDMYVVIMPGYPEGIEVNETTQKAHNLPAGTKLVYRPYFQLFTAQKDVAMWSPSGSDALAEDWAIIQDKAPAYKSEISEHIDPETGNNWNGEPVK